MKHIYTAAFIGATLMATAQTQVTQSSSTFESGVHATFAVNFEFEDVSAKDVESFWKDKLKDMSEEISTKKELRATRARIPAISPDTITILGHADQPKKSPVTTMHLAFNVGGQFVGSDADDSLVEACRSFVYENSVAFKRDVMTKQLEDQQKDLEKLKREQSGLEKEKERAEKNLEKTRDKLKDEEKEKAAAAAEVKALESSIKVKQEEVGAGATETNTAALNDLIKEKDKQIDLRDRADKAARNAEKKIGDLEHDIKKNIQDQETKKTEIEAQTKKVADMTKALEDLN